MEINMTIFLVEAFVSNKKIDSLINKFYEKHKYRAYQLAKESKLYDHPLMSSGNLYREIKARRSLGLLLLSQENEDALSCLHKIFKKGWSQLVNHIEKLKRKNLAVDINAVQLKFFNESQTAEKANAIAVIAYFLANHFDLEFVKNESLQFLENFLVERLQFHTNTKHPFLYKYTTKEKQLLANKLLKEIESTYGSIYFKNIEMMFSMSQKNKDFQKTVFKYAYIFDAEKMMAEDVCENQEISKALKLDILSIYCYLNEKEDILKTESILDATKFLISGILLKKTIQSFKKAKEYFFENNKETLFLAFEKKEKLIESITAEKNILENENKTLKTKIKILQASYKNSLEKENEDLKKALAIAEEEKATLKALNREVAILRSSLYQSEEPSRSDQTVDIDFLNEKKGIIIGGHQSWHRELKKYLNYDCVFETNAQLLNVIENYEVVLFKTSYLNHPTYVKVIEKIRKSNSTFGYIQHSNIDLCLREISEIVKNKL